MNFNSVQGTLTDCPGEKDNATQAEVYAWVDLPQGFHLTPSIQWLKHGGMGIADSTIDDVAVVGITAIVFRKKAVMRTKKPQSKFFALGFFVMCREL